MQRNIDIINAKFTVIEDSRKPNLMNGRMLSHIRKLWGISKPGKIILVMLLKKFMDSKLTHV